jgi:hypothetical protein
MEVYSPFHLTRKESQDEHRDFHEQVAQMKVSDETLNEYVRVFFEHYRGTLEGFFSDLASSVPFYAQYPFRTSILRLGNNGVIIGHRPNQETVIEVLRPTDLDPPLQTVNIFDVIQRLQTPFYSFDFRVRSYSAEEAELVGIRQALAVALDYFWWVVDPSTFEQLCVELLKAESVELETEVKLEGTARYDAIGKALLTEPAGFRRLERWAFEFKHHQDDRVSAQDLRQIEAYLEADEPQIEIVCLATSGDLTSIGRHIAVRNSRIRVWDRTILDSLANQHLDVLERFFPDYAVALEEISQQFEEAASEVSPVPGHPQENTSVIASVPSRLEEFESRLARCPSGRAHFSKYEKIGTELWHYLFPEELGEPKPQSRTLDGKQRRDVLFRNHRSTRFFQRTADRFDADFIIVDFKNYKDPIDSQVVNDVEKYANKALGHLIVVVSRAGADETVESTQVRIFRDSDTVVIVISDEQMLEMVSRRERGDRPEDVLEDLLDELLRKY